jgi:hypothetical protein
MKYKVHLTRLRNSPEKLTKGRLVYLFLKVVQVNFIFSDNGRILYIHYFKFVLQIAPNNYHSLILLIPWCFPYYIEQYNKYQPRNGARVAQWVRSLDLTTHASLSPIRRGFASSFVNYEKSALDSQPQLIKCTSCLPMVGGSHRLLRLPPPLKLVAMI